MTDGKLVFLNDMHRVFVPFWRSVTNILEKKIRPLIEGERVGASLLRFVKGIAFLNLQHYFLKEIVQAGKTEEEFDEYVVTKQHVNTWKHTQIHAGKLILCVNCKYESLVLPCSPKKRHS